MEDRAASCVLKATEIDIKAINASYYVKLKLKKGTVCPLYFIEGVLPYNLQLINVIRTSFLQYPSTSMYYVLFLRVNIDK